MTDPLRADQARADELRVWYENHYFRCEFLLPRLTAIVAERLRTTSAAAGILTSRTKAVDSFVEKAMKLDPNTGEYRYADPKTDIQDVIGLRIVMPLSSDLPPAEGLVEGLFSVVVKEDRGAQSAALGYSGTHYIVRVKAGDPAFAELERFADLDIEFQVRASLQDAWAALQHDLVFKTERDIPIRLQKQVSALSGLLHLADLQFAQIRRELTVSTEASAEEEDLVDESDSSSLSSAALRVLVERTLGQTDTVDQTWFVELMRVAAQLHLTSATKVQAALGEWAREDHAKLVSQQLTAARPYTNPVQVFDHLLRLGLGEDYFERRAGSAAAPADLEAARDSYQRSLNDLKARVGPS